MRGRKAPISEKDKGARAVAAVAEGARAAGATAAGAAAAGALAGGAVAVGALAIRTLAVKRAKVGRLEVGELEVGRLRVRELITGETRPPRPFDVLEGHKYVSLTTYRKNGEAVPTPLWFATVDGRVYMTTDPNSGKMKRIRNNPRVELAPSSARGKPKGESVEGIARPIEEGKAPERAERALHEKYRIGLGLFHLFGQREIGKVTLEIRPAAEEPGGAQETEAAR